MRGFLLRRIATFVPTLLLVLLATFAVTSLVPSTPIEPDPAEPGTRYRESIERFREQFGLDRPLFLNFRWRTTSAEVRALLDRGVGGGVDAANACDRVAELGRFGVAPLVEIAGDPATPEPIADLALRVLPSAARLPRAERARLAFVGELTPAERAARVAEWRARGPFEETGVLARAAATLTDTRLAAYLGRLARLDFGDSMVDHRPVLPELWSRVKSSLALSLVSIVLAYLVAVPLGVFSAARRGTRGERATTFFVFALYSLPVYFAATLLLRFFTVGAPFRWFPTGGLSSSGAEGWPFWHRAADVVWHLALPVFCLTYGAVTLLSRYVRGSMLEALDSDFVRTARAKGASRSRVLYRHALRNALLPMLTLLGSVLPAVFSGAVIVEIVFDIPGTGTYIWRSIVEQDLNAILATTLIGALLTLVGFLVSDVAYAIADPRIRVAGDAAPMGGAP